MIRKFPFLTTCNFLLLIFILFCSYIDVTVPFQHPFFLTIRVFSNRYHFSFDSVKEKGNIAETGNDEISNYRASNRMQKSSILKDFSHRELLSTLISVAKNRRASIARLFSVAAVRPATILVDSLPNLSTDEIVDCIWCLGALYSRLRESSISSFPFTDEIETLEVQKSHVLFAATAIQVINDRLMSGMDKTMMSRTAAKLLYGLMKLRLSWKQLELAGYAVDVALPTLLLNSVPNMNSQGVSNMLYSLGKMQMPVRYSSFDQQEHKIKVAQLLVKALLQQLQAVAATKSFKGQVISNSLWGMYSLGLRWNKLPSSTRSALFAAIARECFRMSPQSVGNTLYALGKMGLRVHQLPDQMLMALELSLRKSAPSMKDNDVIQVFYGMALMKFRWGQHLTAETKEVLSIAVYNKAIKWQADKQVESAVEVATLVYSLSRLQVKWEDLGRVYRTAIILGVLSIPEVVPNKRSAKSSREFDSEDIESNFLVPDDQEDQEEDQEEEEGQGDVGPISVDYTMADEDYLSELQRVQEMVFAKNESRASVEEEHSERFDQQLRQQFQSRRQRWWSSALSGSSQPSSSSEKESNGVGSNSNPLVDTIPGELPEDMSTSTDGKGNSDDSLQASLARSVATILYGLVAMKFDPNSRFSYTYLEDIGAVAPASPQFPLKEKEVRLSLLRAMRDSCSFMNAQELGLAVYGLGCLEVNWWKDLSEDFREKLLSTISHTLRGLSSAGSSSGSSSSGSGESGRLQVIANLMFGLWKMKVPWLELPMNLRSLLEERIVDGLRADQEEVVPFNNLVIFLNTVTNMLASNKKSPLHTNTFRHSVLVAIARSMYAHENVLPRGGHVTSRLFDFSVFSEMSDAPSKDVSLILNILGRLGIEERLLRKYWILQTKADLRPTEKEDLKVYMNTVDAVGLSRRDEGGSEGVTTTTILRSLHVNNSEDTAATQGLNRYNHPVYTAPSTWRAGATTALSNTGDRFQQQAPFLREPLLARFYKLISYTAKLDMTLQGAMLCLQALAKMKVRWMYIPVSVRRDLLTVVIRESVVSQDASQAIAIIVHSLGKLNCKWTEMESNFFTDDPDESPNRPEYNGISEALQSLLGQSIHRMDCQNLANVLSGIRDMDALSDSGRGTLSPAVLGSLLDAVASKLPSYDAKEIEQEEEKEESSHSRRSGESRASRLDSSSRDRFTTDGLVALCLALCYIDRHTGTQLSLLRAQDSSNSLLKGIMRAVSACCSSGVLTSIQAALLLRGLEELGWLRFLSPKSKAALLLPTRQPKPMK